MYQGGESNIFENFHGNHAIARIFDVGSNCTGYWYIHCTGGRRGRKLKFPRGVKYKIQRNIYTTLRI